MKKQINPTIKAHLIRSAFYVLLLLAVCVIPFALAQLNAPKQPAVQQTRFAPSVAASALAPRVAPNLTGKAATIADLASGKAKVVQSRAASAAEAAQMLGQRSLQIHKSGRHVTGTTNVLWYNGDFNGVNGLANGENWDGTGEYARVYDDFNVPSGGWTVGGVFSDNLSSTNITGAYWEIRQGVSEGNGGTLIASGLTMTPIVTPTGRSGFGFTEYMVEVTGLNVSLSQGTYWLTVSPVGDASGPSYDSTTSGANCVGTPCGNDANAFWDSNLFGVIFTSTSNGGVPGDFSMGVEGSTGGGTCMLGPWSFTANYPGGTIEAPCVGSDGTLVYVAGGFLNEAGATNLTYTYDPGSNTWTPKTNMTEPRYATRGVFASNVGKFYVFGGLDENFAVTATTQIYDPVANSWGIGADMPDAGGRYFPGVAYDEASGKIYVVGGFDNTGTESHNNWIYDPVTDTWNLNAAGSIIDAVAGAGTTEDQTRRLIYAEGTWNGGLGSTENQFYDVAGGFWTKGNPMPVPVYDPAAVSLSGLLYIIGGGDPDLSSGGDSSKALPGLGGPLPGLKNNHAPRTSSSWITRMGQKLGLLRRNAAAPLTSYTDTRIYDRDTGDWTVGPSLNQARSFTAGTAVGNSAAVVVGGFDGVSSDTNTAEISNCGSGGGSPTPTPTVPPCIVVNGGFETGSFPPWTISGDTSFTGVNGDNVHSGSFSEETGPGSSDGFTDQVIPTVAGQAYDVTFWLANTDPTGTNRFGASFGSVTLVPEAVQSEFGYTQYTFTNVIPGANADLHFIFYNEPAYFYLDDVCVTPSGGGGTPTPTPTATGSPTCPPGVPGPLWYNGDFNGVNGLGNEDNDSLGAGNFASVYDDFVVPSGPGWLVTSVFSDNLENTNVTGASWEIRQGVSSGNGGTLIASGMTMTPVVTATGRSGFGFTEFMIEVTGLNVSLPPGTYWLNVTPIGDGVTGRSFDSNTSGANCVGTPCGNNLNSFWNSNFFGANFEDTGTAGDASDFSMGVNGTAGLPGNANANANSDTDGDRVAYMSARWVRPTLV